MSVSCLLQGRVLGEIQTRPTKTGGRVTFFKIKVTNGNANCGVYRRCRIRFGKNCLGCGMATWFPSSGR
jgi:hypothetical protein